MNELLPVPLPFGHNVHFGPVICCRCKNVGAINQLCFCVLYAYFECDSYANSVATYHYMGLVGDGDNFVGYGLKTNGAMGKVFDLVSVESGS